MWGTTTILSILTMTWECARNRRRWMRARWTALNSRMVMCQVRYLPDLTPQATMSPRSLRHRPTDTRQPSLKWAEHNWMLSTRAGARWAYIEVESRQTSKKMVCWTGASTLFWPFNQRASAWRRRRRESLWRITCSLELAKMSQSSR